MARELPPLKTLIKYLEASSMPGEVPAQRLRRFAYDNKSSIHAVRKWLRRERTPRPGTMKRILNTSKGEVTFSSWFEGL